MTEQQIAPLQQEEAHRESRSAPGPPAPSKDRPRLLVPAVIVVIVAVGAFIAWRILAQPKTPANIVALSGRIEGDEVDLHHGARWIAIQ